MTMSLVMATAVDGARAEEIEQVFVEATVLKSGKVVSKPNLLVRLGEQAEIAMPPKNGSEPRLGLKFRAEAPTEAERKAVVTGVVDGKDAAAATLRYSKEGEAKADFDGGGYSWSVRVARMTPQLLERKKSEIAERKRRE
jgi:hypothetical protein